MLNAKYKMQNTKKGLQDKDSNIVGQCKWDKVMVSKDDRLRNSSLSSNVIVRTSWDVGRLRHMVIVAFVCLLHRLYALCELP